MKQFADAAELNNRLAAAHTDLHDVLGNEQRRVLSVWLECLGDLQIAAMLNEKPEHFAEYKTRAELFAALLGAVDSRRSTGHLF